jgi:hypothetical protein
MDPQEQHPWYWEGHVQDRIVDYLRINGWTIKHVSNTTKREPGVDILAASGVRSLRVEVIGYPEDKGKTPPWTQARNWYSRVLMTALGRYSPGSQTEVAIAFPGMTTYRNLFAKTQPALRSLGIGTYFVEADGSVRRVLNHTTAVTQRVRPHGPCPGYTVCPHRRRGPRSKTMSWSNPCRNTSSRLLLLNSVLRSGSMAKGKRAGAWARARSVTVSDLFERSRA